MGVNLLAECNGFMALGKHLGRHTAASKGKIRKKSILLFYTVQFCTGILVLLQQLLILSHFAFSLNDRMA